MPTFIKMTNSKIEVLIIVQNNFGLKFNPTETKIRIFRRFQFKMVT